MPQFTAPHLPIINAELDNTRNWEALQAALVKIEEEGASGGKTGFTNTQIAVAYRSAEQKIKAGAKRKVELDKTIYDPNGLITGGSYKVAVDGLYEVSGVVSPKAPESKDIAAAFIFVNGTEKLRGAYMPPPPESYTPACPVAGIVKCKAGDTIELYVEVSGPERELELGESTNRLSVFRVPPEVAEVEGVAGGSLTGTYPNPTIATAAVSEAMLAAALKTGAWTALSLVAALEFNAGGYEPAVRLEQYSADVRLRGILKAKAGKEVAGGGEICTLAAAFRPSKTVILSTVHLTTPAANYLSIESSGVVKTVLAIKAGEQVALDGLTYSLT